MGEAASVWRANLVRPLLAAYAAAPDVAAVGLSGSTARQTADRWSDVEIMVFWSRPPGDAARRDLAEGAGAVAQRYFPFDESEQVWTEDLAVRPDRLLVEVTHALVSTAEAHLDGLLLRFDPDPLLSTSPRASSMPRRHTDRPCSTAGRADSGRIPKSSRWRLCAAARRSTTSGAGRCTWSGKTRCSWPRRWPR